jgi:hypothetical protein
MADHLPCVCSTVSPLYHRRLYGHRKLYSSFSPSHHVPMSQLMPLPPPLSRLSSLVSCLSSYAKHPLIQPHRLVSQKKEKETPRSPPLLPILSCLLPIPCPSRDTQSTRAFLCYLSALYSYGVTRQVSTNWCTGRKQRDDRGGIYGKLSRATPSRHRVLKI